MAHFSRPVGHADFPPYLRVQHLKCGLLYIGAALPGIRKLACPMAGISWLIRIAYLAVYAYVA